MTEVRLTVRDDGTVVWFDGRAVGRLTEIVLAVDPAFCGPWGEPTEGGGSSSVGGDPPVGKEPEKKTRKEKAPSELDRQVETVWLRYVKLFGSAYHFNPKRKRIIVNALKVRSLDAVLKALDGLRVSPFHNGENSDQRKYLDIRYALSGNQRTGESIEERIDAMGANAERYSAPVAAVSEDGTPAQVQRLFDAAIRAFDNRRFNENWRNDIGDLVRRIRNAGYGVDFTADGRPSVLRKDEEDS